MLELGRALRDAAPAVTDFCRIRFKCSLLDVPFSAAGSLSVTLTKQKR